MNGYVYLIHFDTPVAHARHYIGYTIDVDKRMAMHSRGAGARLCKSAKSGAFTGPSVGFGWVIAPKNAG